MKKLNRALSVLLLVCLTLSLAACSSAPEGAAVDGLQKARQNQGISVHDPYTLKHDGTYYIFGSHMTAARSTDLESWTMFADGYYQSNPVYGQYLEGGESFAYTGKYEDGGWAIWAPSVMYNEALDKWVMYYSASRNWIASNICMATADRVEGPYTYEATLLYSGWSSVDIDKTNVKEILGEDMMMSAYMSNGTYDHLNWPNCIDPTVFYDKDGALWMVYGSWAGGIFLLEIDETTGLPIHPEQDKANAVDPYFGKRLIGQGHKSCEGPFIYYDAGADYYYLFVSYGALTQKGGYQIRLYRSKAVDGPYQDAADQTLGMVLDHSTYGLKMMGNYSFPSLDGGYMATGHNSALVDEDGSRYLIYHTRFEGKGEYHEPRVHQMFVTEDGWLVAAPFAYAGEKLKADGYAGQDAAAGVYYVVDHGTDIGEEIHGAQAWKLSANGKVSGDDISGTWSVTAGTNYITLTLGETVYHGVIVEMTDEAGNPVRCFSAAGNNNETLMGVHYLSE